MGLSFSHIVIVLLVVLIVFGAGKLPKVMGDLGKGIRKFKEGMDGHDEAGSKVLLEKDEEKKEE
ncbi:MAG: twin-arginine translocase TatA/TatE family subunit [Alphaproteobacteria bacterium]|nr:twin-arginine translocase TatA/TatE family subunit [Alphaproteobacteria bacterium]MCL2505162.1 twin-arginine translocase TatA/TatE family subunit [Alphaproteobacteria bacterium]